MSSGQNTQGTNSVAIGSLAGQESQSDLSVAIGSSAGQNTQAKNAIAIGTNAGQIIQGSAGISIGLTAGQNTQGSGGIAIGLQAGSTKQGQNAVAIGVYSGQNTQGDNAISIGALAGESAQGQQGIAIALQAGRAGQGTNAIAIGNQAGITSQPSNSIVINASGTALNGGSASATYISPMRALAAATAVYYNSTTFELSYLTSSRRYKTNIIDLLQNTENIYKLQPKEYDYTPDNNKHLIGFIAEEAFSADPYFAVLNSDENPEAIDWNNIITYLVAEIKKLNNRVIELELKTVNL